MRGWKTFSEKRNYWISTTNMETIFGLVEVDVDYKYETLIFPVVNGEIKYGDEVECLRTKDEDEAYLNHLMMFEKYNNL